MVGLTEDPMLKFFVNSSVSRFEFHMQMPCLVATLIAIGRVVMAQPYFSKMKTESSYSVA